MTRVRFDRKSTNKDWNQMDFMEENTKLIGGENLERSSLRQQALGEAIR